MQLRAKKDLLLQVTSNLLSLMLPYSNITTNVIMDISGC